MFRYVAISFLLFSCATPESRQSELHDGPMIAPPSAAEFNPAWDAPHSFDRPQRTIQPQPRPTRVLPEDEHTRREPTIWAAETPRASHQQSLPPPAIIGIPLPLPDSVTSKTEALPAYACAAAATLGIRNTSALRDAVAGLADDDKKCLASALYLKCTDQLARRQEQFKWREWRNMSQRQKGDASAWAQKMTDTANVAGEFYWLICAKEQLPPHLQELLNRVLSAMPDPLELTP